MRDAYHSQSLKSGSRDLPNHKFSQMLISILGGAFCIIMERSLEEPQRGMRAERAALFHQTAHVRLRPRSRNAIVLFRDIIALERRD
jgi:hypothetical protein